MILHNYIMGSNKSFLTWFLPLILIAKISWVILLVGLSILNNARFSGNIELKYLELLEEIIHLILLLLIGILIIYLFNHLTPARVCIDGETKLYLYMFGILMGIGSLKKLYYVVTHKKDHSKTILDIHEKITTGK